MFGLVLISGLARDGSYEFILPLPKFMSASAVGGGLGAAVAPMPGVIEKVIFFAGVCKVSYNFTFFPIPIFLNLDFFPRNFLLLPLFPTAARR